MATQKKPLNEQIKEIKDKLVSNSKDAEWTKKMTNELLSLHTRSLHQPVELEIPTKEVKETIDFGACKISRTIRGYLFEAKGGMYTFVESRMSRVCAMFNTIFELHAKENKDEEEQKLYNAFVDAVQYVLQAPIFASLSEISLFAIATNIRSVFNEYCKEYFEEAEATEETEEDIKANDEDEKIAKGLEVIANIPVPPEE